AAAPVGAARAPDPPADRDGPALHGAAPVHERRAEPLDPVGPPPDLSLRLPEQPGRRLWDGRGAQPDARGVPRDLHGRLLPADPRLEHELVIRPVARGA